MVHHVPGRKEGYVKIPRSVSPLITPEPIQSFPLPTPRCRPVRLVSPAQHVWLATLQRVRVRALSLPFTPPLSPIEVSPEGSRFFAQPREPPWNGFHPAATSQGRKAPSSTLSREASGFIASFLCMFWAPPRRELWVTAGFPPSLQPCQPSIILGQPFVEMTITEDTWPQSSSCGRTR